MAREDRPLGGAAPTQAFSNGTVLQGLGGRGVVQQIRPGVGARPGLRTLQSPAEHDLGPDFRAAMAALGIVEQETLVVDAVDASGTADDTAVLLPAPPTEPGALQVLLYQDESGGLSWHFDDAAEPTPAAPGAAPRPGLRDRSLTAGAGGARFTIPLRSAAAQLSRSGGLPRPGLRGPLTRIGRKLFKVLVLPVLSWLLQDPVRWIGEKIESRIARNRVWELTPDNYRLGPQQDFSDWPRLTTGPVLLAVHGIFSSVQGMLGSLPREALQAWHQRYGGRVIAFNHPTVSASPEDNARLFLQTVQAALPGQRLVFDILCHSRGGIVSRALAERAQALLPGTACEFRSVYFAATPNAGSPIADADHMVDMIDLFTNGLTRLPDGPVAYSIDLLLGLVTVLAHAGVVALPGIAALGTRPDGYIPRNLNGARQPSAARYAAAAADYEPQPGRDNGFLIDRLGDPLIDRIFVRDGVAHANDLVVPQQGVFAANGHPSFPIADPLVYEAGDGVWHTAFFAQPRTLQHIQAHLDAVWAAPAVSAEAAPAPPSRPSFTRPTLRQPSRTAAGEVRVMGGVGDKGWMGDRGAASQGLPAAGAGGRGGRVKLRESGEVHRMSDGGSASAGLTAAPPPPPPPPPPHAEWEAVAAAPADASEAADAIQLQRDPVLGFPTEVQAGERRTLVVALTLPPAGPAPAERLLLDLAAGEDALVLDAELSAPGFRVIGERRQTITVRRVHNPATERAQFELEAADPGAAPLQRLLQVSFWRDNECVGGVSATVRVQPAGGSPAAEPAPAPAPASPGAPALPPAHLRVPRERRQDPDLVIRVTRLALNQDLFEISLRCEWPGEEYESRPFGLLDLSGTGLRAYLGQALDPVFQRFPGVEVPDAQYPAAVSTWSAGLMGTLESLGRLLWQRLPEAFRHEYLRLCARDDPPRSLCVFSDEFEFPWEIVRPSGLLGGVFHTLEPLGARHVLGRWRPSTGLRPQPQALRVQGMVLVSPDATESGLDFSVQEVAELRRLIPQAQLLQPPDRQAVNALLDGAGGHAVLPQVVHYSGHGSLGPNADLNALQLAGGTQIDAMAFAGRRLGAQGQPLLYLNACTVGRGGVSVGRSGGFAVNCIDSGWSGVIAPYWPVVDDAAARFSVRFYTKLRRGCSIGEALQELRCEQPDDPSSWAYSYFGDPHARLMFD